MIGIPLALIGSNALEWVIHKHVLHGMGRSPERFWGFHLWEHHAHVLKNAGYDADYERPWWTLSARRREVLGLSLMVVPLLPLAPVAPFFVATSAVCAVRYYRAHKRAHLDPAWAREHLPWHYDHHMGPDQEANWCVTNPWWDRVRGTRRPYVGTADEARDEERRRRIRESARPTRADPARSAPSAAAGA